MPELLVSESGKHSPQLALAAAPGLQDVDFSFAVNRAAEHSKHAATRGAMQHETLRLSELAACVKGARAGSPLRRADRARLRRHRIQHPAHTRMERGLRSQGPQDIRRWPEPEVAGICRRDAGVDDRATRGQPTWRLTPGLP